MKAKDKMLLSELASLKDAIVIDTETTGLSPGKHAELLEIAAAKIRIFPDGDIKIVGKFKTLVKPELGKVPVKITEITGITTEDVADAPYIEEVMPKLHEFIKGYPLIAHSGQFDERFLAYYFRKVGIMYACSCLCEEKWELPRLKMIDTCKIDRVLHPERVKHDQNTICESYGYINTKAHRAYGDVKTLCGILRRYLWEIKNIPREEFSTDKEIELPVYDVKNLRLKSFRKYSWKNKALGSAVYFTTNYGMFYYHQQRRVWGVQRNFFAENISIEEASRQLMLLSGMSEEELWAY